jgi:hypothetical protein
MTGCSRIARFSSTRRRISGSARGRDRTHALAAGPRSVERAGGAQRRPGSRRAWLRQDLAAPPARAAWATARGASGSAGTVGVTPAPPNRRINSSSDIARCNLPSHQRCLGCDKTRVHVTTETAAWAPARPEPRRCGAPVRCPAASQDTPVRRASRGRERGVGGDSPHGRSPDPAPCTSGAGPGTPSIASHPAGVAPRRHCGPCPDEASYPGGVVHPTCPESGDREVASQFRFRTRFRPRARSATPRRPATRTSAESWRPQRSG